MDPFVWLSVLGAVLGMVAMYLHLYLANAISAAAEKISAKMDEGFRTLRQELVARDHWESERHHLEERMARLENRADRLGGQ